MDSKANSRAVRVGGEVIVLHCWACGTAHSVNLESCGFEELAHMVCSNSNCRMSMFLVNELLVDNETRRQMTNSELGAHFAVLSRFWR
jgi:hypothetical protein